MTSNACTICDIKLSNCWEKPKPRAVYHDVGLKVMNSLTREKETFITMDGSRSVKWYM